MEERHLSKGNTPEYANELIRLLAGRDPLELMAQAHSQFQDAVAGLPDDEAGKPEGPGKWSVRDVVQHMADTEWILGARYRLIAAEEDVTLPFFDQDAWARELNYAGSDVNEALADFGALRAINVRFLRGLPPSRLERVGLHPERGPESLQHCIDLYACHDLQHLAQIGRIRQAIGSTSR